MCGLYLMDNDATDVRELDLGEAAHIVARANLGPRGDDPLPIEKRNEFHNLVVLCPTDHALIDDSRRNGTFDAAELRSKKQAHEELVKRMTGVDAGKKTRVMRVLGTIRGHRAEATASELRIAIVNSTLRYPEYSTSHNDIDVDLRSLDEASPTYWYQAVEMINRKLDHALDTRLDEASIAHLSVFALARIPLLVHLGSRLSDKIATDIYQRHRTPVEGWIWPAGETVEFGWKESVPVNGNVATIVMSVSGNVRFDQIDRSLTEGGLIEIRPVGIEPHRDIINSFDTLQSARSTIEKVLRRLEATVGRQGEIRLLGAIPASVAVMFGRELLRGVTPKVAIYDFIDNQYQQMLSVTV